MFFTPPQPVRLLWAAGSSSALSLKCGARLFWSIVGLDNKLCQVAAELIQAVSPDFSVPIYLFLMEGLVLYNDPYFFQIGGIGIVGKFEAAMGGGVPQVPYEDLLGLSLGLIALGLV